MPDEKTYEKVNDTTFKAVEVKTQETIHNITDLKNDIRIYEEEIAVYQRKIDDAYALLVQAEIIGVK